MVKKRLTRKDFEKKQKELMEKLLIQRERVKAAEKIERREIRAHVARGGYFNPKHKFYPKEPRVKPKQPKVPPTRKIMMSPIVDPKILEKLEGATLLDPRELDAAIIGTYHTKKGKVAVYDYDKLVGAFVALRGKTSELDDDDDLEASDVEAWEQAMEWVEYNTIRALPYVKERAPIIVQLGGEDPKFKFNGQKYTRVA